MASSHENLLELKKLFTLGLVPTTPEKFENVVLLLRFSKTHFNPETFQNSSLCYFGVDGIHFKNGAS